MDRTKVNGFTPPTGKTPAPPPAGVVLFEPSRGTIERSVYFDTIELHIGQKGESRP